MSISSTRGNLYVMSESTWKPPSGVYAMQANTWNPVQKVYVMTNGEWEQVWPSDAVTNDGATILMIELDGSAEVTNGHCLDPRWYLTGTGNVKNYLYGNTKVNYSPSISSDTKNWGVPNLWYRGNRATVNGAFVENGTMIDWNGLQRNTSDSYDLAPTSDGYRLTRLTFHGQYPWVWENESYYTHPTNDGYITNQGLLPGYDHYYYTGPWKHADTITPPIWSYKEVGGEDWPLQRQLGDYNHAYGVEDYEWFNLCNSSSQNAVVVHLKTSTYEQSATNHYPLRCFINISALKYLFPNEKIYIQGSAQWQESTVGGHNITKGGTQVGMKVSVIKGTAIRGTPGIPNPVTSAAYDTPNYHFLHDADASSQFFNQTWNATVGDPNNLANAGEPSAISPLMKINELSNNKISINSSYQVTSVYTATNQSMGDRIGCIEIDLAKNEIKFVDTDYTSEANSVFNTNSFPWNL